MIHADVVLNYALSSESVISIYTRLRRDYPNRIIEPAIQEAVKASTARYTAEELITRRADVKHDIETLLAQRLLAHGIIVDTMNMTNFDFSDDFSHAIEIKVIAEQRALQSKNDLERIKIEAQQQIETAKAQAESIRIRSEALASSPKLVEWEAVQKWDGKLPQFTGGAGVPFINVPLAQGAR